MKEITMAELKKILEQPDIITGLFDTVRVVQGGGTCCVCRMESDAMIPTTQKCHNYWDRCEKCSNCVSKKAQQQGHKMVKLEYVNENYYFVIAQPFSMNGAPYILELITNITTNMATDEGSAEQGTFVHDLIRQLEHISEREAFTGLYNKNYFEKDFSLRLNTLPMEPHPQYLAMFDIDDFKLINDLYGHVQGDTVLLKFADILHTLAHTEGVRASGGYVARFGGDEFVVVFGDQPRAACESFLGKAKASFDETLFSVAEMSFHVTASYGLAEVSAAKTTQDALDLADRQLYLAKEKKPGRRNG